MERDEKRFKRNREGTYARKFKSTIKRRFNDFHSNTRKIKLKVAKKMKVKYAGGQAFSPKYRIYSETINFWKRMVKLKRNVNTSRTILRRLAKRINVPWILASITSLTDCKNKLKEAYKEYHRQKPNFPKWRNEFNKSLIDALAKEKNVAKEKIHRRIKRERKAREMGKRARMIRGKNIKLPVMRAVATDENGTK